MEQGKKKSRYSKKKFLLTFIIVMGLFAAIRHVFKLDIPLHTDSPLAASNQAYTASDNGRYISESMYEKASLPEEDEEEELSDPSDTTQRTRGVHLGGPEGYDEVDPRGTVWWTRGVRFAKHYFSKAFRISSLK